MIPRVLNKRTAKPWQLEDAVYVGRPSKWGNPFVVGKDGTHGECVELHAKWLLKRLEANPEGARIALNELRGKSLVCFCAPAKCHADLLLELANYWEVER